MRADRISPWERADKRVKRFSRALAFWDERCKAAEDHLAEPALRDARRFDAASRRWERALSARVKLEADGGA